MMDRKMLQRMADASVEIAYDALSGGKTGGRDNMVSPEAVSRLASTILSQALGFELREQALLEDSPEK